MNYNELLPKWAELAPDECRQKGTHWQVKKRLHPEAPRVWVALDNSKAQLEVQRAIEVRGWRWESILSSKNHYRARVGDWIRWFNIPPVLSKQSPGLALLTAYVKYMEYLQALESEVK